jgi:hypothetical protein
MRLDHDFLVYAIKDKLDQIEVSDNPNKLSLEINLLYRRLQENDKNLQPMPCEQARE